MHFFCLDVLAMGGEEVMELKVRKGMELKGRRSRSACARSTC